MILVTPYKPTPPPSRRRIPSEKVREVCFVPGGGAGGFGLLQGTMGGGAGRRRRPRAAGGRFGPAIGVRGSERPPPPPPQQQADDNDDYGNSAPATPTIHEWTNGVGGIILGEEDTYTPSATPTATTASGRKIRLVIRHTPRGKGDRERLVGDRVTIGGTVEAKGNSSGAICASRLLREADFERMPSLEAAMALRRKSEVELELEVNGVKEKAGGTGRQRARSEGVQKKGKANGGAESSAITNGFTNGTSSSSASSVSKAQSDHRDEKPLSKHEKPLERNIDHVIFGDVTFKAWYPSWYPKEIIGEKALHGESKGIVVPELYVCKRCFGYGKVLVDWVRHCRCCEKGVPGERVYSHGVGRGGNETTWSVWEVDGSVDTLFCQNLSLFAKLFLDNKSVFFDVQGFNYFLLVHTSPPSSPTPNAQQIVGFFSKEKMSWDNNNLACILVFPPWQRKGLGALLMGVSYAIARREGILGGPEKPISELGRKGYKRYWGGEIARWLLEHKESDKKKNKGTVDVKMISDETWIVPEDCLVVLREMGVVEKAGRGKGTIERVRVDKEKVREWVERERIGLERVVLEDGFVEGYAMKEDEEEEELEEEDQKMEGT